ncbi:MAG: alpha-galactosidase, partial [Dorea sp.]
EADTLIVTCKDPATDVKFIFYYTAMRDYPVICRRMVIENTTKTEQPLDILRCYSACLDFANIEPQAELVHLWGTWGRERYVERKSLMHGSMSVSSTRGASSHYHNPFAALVTKDTTEETGMAIGMSLVYSGNFDITCDVDPFGATRLMAGINPVDFTWRLEYGETFATPEVVIVISDKGLGKMSRTYHKLYRTHLCRGEWKDKERPILVNNWEATYFDFTDEKLLEIARIAAECGIEMFVMDDGWFGERNSGDCSLGDWYVNEEKLKCGLPKLAEQINEMGLKFGIWFEPEAISPGSKLITEHPDWCMQVEGRAKSLARNQYILDMTREDVRDYLFNVMSETLSTANIEYIKWDFNRNLTEVGSAVLPPHRRQEIFHRYVLGLYDLLERLVTAFPHLLLEGCASGGGRYDPAMLYYSPQYWTSDDTDAMERLEIQLGTSMVYPASSMSCHVSASPNHQTQRETSFETRGNIAMGGAFGYELDLTMLTEEEKEMIKKQVADYHRYYDLINRGDLYRLILPTDTVNGKCGKCAAWMYVSEDQSEAIVSFVVIRTSIHPVYFLKLRGLDPDAVYVEEATGKEYHGDTLMNAGLNLTSTYKDGDSVMIHFIRK